MFTSPGAFRFTMSLGLVLGYIVFFYSRVVAAAVVMQTIHRRHRFPINNDNPAIRLTVFVAIVLRSYAVQAGPVSGRAEGTAERRCIIGRHDRPSQPGPFVHPCTSDRASSTGEMKLQKAVSETE